LAGSADGRDCRLSLSGGKAVGGFRDRKIAAAIIIAAAMMANGILFLS
jgi:hypothetical protein